MSNKITTLGSIGLPALCNHIKSLKNVTIQLGEAFQGAVAEIEEAINDFPIASSISISTNGWHPVTPNNSAGDYNYYYDLISNSIDSSDVPLITLSPASLTTAAACGLCTTCESFNGYIRLYSEEIPSEVINIQCFIIKGKQGG